MAFRGVALGRVTARAWAPSAAARASNPMAVTRRTMAGGSETYDVMGTKLSTEQLVCAVSGFYFSLYLVSKLFGGKKKDEAPGARRARDGRARDGRDARGPVADALTRVRPSFAARALSLAAASVSMGMGSSSIPSIIDEGFEKWASAPGNLAKWEKSLETSFK